MIRFYIGDGFLRSILDVFGCGARDILLVGGFS